MNIYSYIGIKNRGKMMNKDKEKNTELQLDDEILYLTSQTFKALSDPTRVRILYLLSQRVCSVNEIAQQLSLNQSTVSHQLRLLKNLRLVKFKRVGTSIYYSPDDEHVMSILKQTINHVMHD